MQFDIAASAGNGDVTATATAPIFYDLDDDSMVAPIRVGATPASQAPVAAPSQLVPVSPTQAQEVSWLNGLNADGSLTSTSYWGSGGGTAHKFGASTAGTGATITYWFDNASAFTETEKATFLTAFASWEAVADVHFVLAADQTSADALMKRGSDGGAYESGNYYLGSGNTIGRPAAQAFISIDTSVFGFDLSGSFDVVGGYGLATAIHEVGHLVGLGHGGTYNGAVTPSTQQYSAYDERLYTTMSYISWLNTDGKYAASYPVTGTDWGYSSDFYYRQAPNTAQMLDIQAVQQLYGAPTTTPFDGGETFGFNSSVTGALSRIYDFTINTRPVLTLFDTGTGNTLDLTGYAMAETVNLNPGTFSSVAGLTNNLAIAAGTHIDGLKLGGGNDSVIVNTNGDTVDAGAGTDTVSFAAATAAVTFNLTTGVATGGAGSAMLTNFENVVASPFGGVLTGTVGNNIFYAGAGNDTFIGGGGVDMVDYSTAGSGVTVSLNAAATQTTGGSGTDQLTGFTNLTGSNYDDTLSGNTGNNVLIGGAGFDTVSYAYVTAATGVTVDLAAHTATGSGTDSVTGFEGIIGSNNADTLMGDGGNNVIDGGLGNDWLDGRGGNDTLIGGGGNDIYFVDSIGDMIVEAVGDAADEVRTTLATFELGVTAGSANVENLTGLLNTGQELYANAGAQVITAGGGNDRLVSADNAETLIGGAGDDIYAVHNSNDVVVETAGNGNDILKAFVSYVLGAGVEVETARLIGTADLTLTGNALSQNLVGNAGNNVIDGGGGGDRMKGAEGNDTFIVRDSSDFIIEIAGNGDDTVKAAVSYTLGAAAQIEHLLTIDATATTAIDLVGNDYSHDIQGNAGVNHLTGGSGDDVLLGLGGADVFVFAAGPVGHDTVGDFASGTDKLDLSAYFADFAGFQAATHDVNGNAVIDLGGGNDVTLTGVASSQLQSSDVITASGQSHVSSSSAHTEVVSTLADTGVAATIAGLTQVDHYGAVAMPAMMAVA